jgi:hypothetical protein
MSLKEDIDLYETLEEIAERGKDLDKLREEIFEYVEKNCSAVDPGILQLPASHKENAVPFEVNLFAEALLRGYHVLVDELSGAIEGAVEAAKEASDPEVHQTLAKFKKNIERAKKLLIEVKLKGH